MQKRTPEIAANWRRLSVIALLLLVGVLSAGAAFAGFPASAPAANNVAVTSIRPAGDKISRDLMARFTSEGANAQVNYWVVLGDQADTSNNIPVTQWAEKGWYVYNLLTKKA